MNHLFPFILGVVFAWIGFSFLHRSIDNDVCWCSKACLKRLEGDCILRKPWEPDHNIEIDIDSSTGLYIIRNTARSSQIMSHSVLWIDEAPDLITADCFHSNPQVDKGKVPCWDVKANKPCNLSENAILEL